MYIYFYIKDRSIYSLHTSVFSPFPLELMNVSVYYKIEDIRIRITLEFKDN